MAGAAATAMALGVATTGGVPEARALDLTWDPAYTAGTYAGILNFVGNAIPGFTIGGGLYDSGPPQSATISVDNVPIVGSLNLKLLLDYISGSSVDNLYNTIGGIPQPACKGSYASNCRYVLELATAEATQNLVEAYRTQIQSVTNGVTPAGFIPFEANPSSTTAKPTQTNQALAFLQNPYRPNGGFYSRFPGWADAFGIDPAMPAPGKYKSADGKIVLNTTTIDATWAYDPTADFPEVPNLLAFTNSLWAALPLNLVTGETPDIVLADAAGNAVTTTTVGLNLAGVLQLGPLPLIGTLPMTDGVAYYATLVSDQLPILTPVRLPGFAINAALKALNSPYLLGNPFADAIEPALKILINVAYPDVVTPTEGGTYNRTFLTGGTEIAFDSVDPLTPEERDAVPGDAWDALKTGVQEQLDKPFWGIIVPNPDNPPQEVTPPAAVQAASAVSDPVETVVAQEVSDSEPQAATPVGVAAEADSAAEVSVDDVAPAVEVSAVAEDSAPVDSAPADSPRAGADDRGSADAGDSDAPRAAASGGRRHSAD